MSEFIPPAPPTRWRDAAGLDGWLSVKAREEVRFFVNGVLTLNSRCQPKLTFLDLINGAAKNGPASKTLSGIEITPDARLAVQPEADGRGAAPPGEPASTR